MIGVLADLFSRTAATLRGIDLVLASNGIFMPMMCAESNSRLRMFLQAENRRAVFGGVGTHTFEHTHAVVQRVGEHMGGGVHATRPVHHCTR
jgi:hypothetical protein